MTLEEQLKSEILTKYKSIRAFTEVIQMPYSTLDSVFKRGIGNAGVVTVLKVFQALDLDMENSIRTGSLVRAGQKNTPEPAAADSGADAEWLTRLLVERGYIKRGEDLSDRDANFLIGVIGILDAWFDK